MLYGSSAHAVCSPCRRRQGGGGAAQDHAGVHAQAGHPGPRHDVSLLHHPGEAARSTGLVCLHVRAACLLGCSYYAVQKAACKVQAWPYHAAPIRNLSEDQGGHEEQGGHQFQSGVINNISGVMIFMV